MYEDYYGLNEKPFSLLPDPSFLFMTKAHTIALTMLEYSVTNESAGICVISGEIGSGKTTLVRKLLNIMGPQYTTGLLSNTHSEFGSLLQWVSLAFGLEYKNKESVELYENFVNFTIEQYASGKRIALIIDEAQNLSHNALEELRMLSNINTDKNHVLQLILVGQPELRETLKIEKMQQLSQRITASYHLSELNQLDSCEYIKHRLITAGGNPDLITDLARKAVWYHSRGIPRVINTLCDTALIYAFAEQKQRVDIRLINDVVNDRMENSFYTDRNTDNHNVTNLDDEMRQIINI